MHLKTVSFGKETEITVVAKENITVALQVMVRNDRVGLEEPSQARKLSSNGAVWKFQKVLCQSVRILGSIRQLAWPLTVCNSSRVLQVVQQAHLSRCKFSFLLASTVKPSSPFLPLLHRL